MKLVEKISRKFSKHEKQYDSNYEEPVIRCSICTGEQVAGFLKLDTGKFEEVMLIRTSQDLENFRLIISTSFILTPHFYKCIG